MTDLEWAEAFVGCKIKGTGVRFGDTVEVLVKKLAEVRQEAARDGAQRETTAIPAAQEATCE